MLDSERRARDNEGEGDMNPSKGKRADCIGKGEKENGRSKTKEGRKIESKG
jgi:hypothetical protein